MSYPGTEQPHTHISEGVIQSLGTPGVIIMGPGGLQVNTLGTSGATLGDTSGPNAVNPSGTPNGIRLPLQNSFGIRRRR